MSDKVTWRDAILEDFVPHVSKLTLVADPDALLTEEKMALQLREKGFDLIEFNDPVEFRYAYEAKYRSIWDSGDTTDLVVILRVEDNELNNLPYDLLQTGRKLSFNLGSIFPNLSYPVLEELPSACLDSVYEAQIQSKPGPMGDNATRDFILRHVFGIAPELIKTEVELLKVLMGCHYKRMDIPPNLGHRLVQSLLRVNTFSKWPLQDIVCDAEAFFAFLQERWPVFIDAEAKKYQGGEVCELSPAAREFAYSGPEELPFGHHDIRIYLDNLFAEGRLQPIDVGVELIENNPWYACGIISDDSSGTQERAHKLYDILLAEMPEADSTYSDWMQFALQWAELGAVYWDNPDSVEVDYKDMSEELNKRFLKWLDRHYPSLVNLPPINPVMVHHIPRAIHRQIDKSQNERIALVVVDGLALDQWAAIRPDFVDGNDSFIIRDNCSFAWIPTTTSVSRQSIFAGKIPAYFPGTIGSTAAEPKLWSQFWENAGYKKREIAYVKNLGDGDPVKQLDDTLSGVTKVIGLVVDKVDKIMHGMELGAAGMHNQIRQWADTGYLRTLVSELLDRGFDVWLTSDHGNTECIGTGKLDEGVLASTRSKRVRIFSNPELRELTASTVPDAKAWPSTGLPPDYYPLLATDTMAFMKEGSRKVSHGGISIGEVMVPFVKIERRNRK